MHDGQPEPGSEGARRRVIHDGVASGVQPFEDFALVVGLDTGAVVNHGNGCRVVGLLERDVNGMASEGQRVLDKIRDGLSEPIGVKVVREARRDHRRLRGVREGDAACGGVGNEPVDNITYDRQRIALTRVQYELFTFEP